MVKYSRYLLSYIFKKKTIYLIPFFLFVLFNLSAILQINATNERGLSFINSLSTFNKFLPFIFMGTFSSMVVVYAFKETELDGSDLLILSKPISRYKMILSKFLVAYFVIFVYAVSTGVNFTIVGLFDSIAMDNDSLASLKFGASLSIGAFVVAVVITSITIVASTQLGKASIITFSALFIPSFPILSFVLSAATEGIPREVEFFRRPSYRLSANDINLSTVPTNEKEIGRFLNETQTTNTYYFLNEDEIIEDFNEYKKNRQYDYIAYFDLWYHWQRFFSIFTQSDRFTRTVIKDFNVKEVQINKVNDDEPIKIGDKEYIFFANASQVGKIVGHLEKYQEQENQIKLIKDIQWIKEYLETKDDFSFMEVASALEFIINDDNDQKLRLDQYEITYKKDEDGKDVQNPKDEAWNNKISPKSAKPNSVGIILYQFLSSENLILDDSAPVEMKLISQILQQNKLKKATKLFRNDDTADYKKQVKNYLIENGTSVDVAQDQDFISTTSIVIFWGLFALFALIGSFIVYYKRDFK